MCKLKQKDSVVISYYSGTPYGFSESVLSPYIPPVEIATKGAEHPVADIKNSPDGVIETENKETDCYNPH